jgi:glycosyltransferase involved in cell wall biosynthesis
LKDDIPNFKFLLIGNGPQQDDLKQLARELGIEERIIFPGWLPDQASLNEALNAADVGLVMRIGQETDHFHMTATLAHEIACAKPVLAANLRGIAEIIKDGENGYLFSLTDPEEFRSKLLNIYRDPELRKAFGQKALQTSLKVSDIETCARQMTAPILQLLRTERVN